MFCFLAILHVWLFFGIDVRKVFGKLSRRLGVLNGRDQLHVGDIHLSREIATAIVTNDNVSVAVIDQKEQRRVAYLFMLKDSLEFDDVWSRYFDSSVDPAITFSIYIHFHMTFPSLQTTSQFEAWKTSWIANTFPKAVNRVQVVPQVHTGWCELMAAEVQLYRFALQDPRNTKFVLLSQDAIPLLPRAAIHGRLLSNDLSSFCFTGARATNVPSMCSYGNGLYWTKKLRLKHHQWTVLSRRHAAKLAWANKDQAFWDKLLQVFVDQYTQEPLCSDEILPILAVLLGANERDEKKREAMLKDVIARKLSRQHVPKEHLQSDQSYNSTIEAKYALRDGDLGDGRSYDRRLFPLDHSSGDMESNDGNGFLEIWTPLAGDGTLRIPLRRTNRLPPPERIEDIALTALERAVPILGPLIHVDTGEITDPLNLGELYVALASQADKLHFRPECVTYSEWPGCAGDIFSESVKGDEEKRKDEKDTASIDAEVVAGARISYLQNFFWAVIEELRITLDIVFMVNDVHATPLLQDATLKFDTQQRIHEVLTTKLGLLFARRTPALLNVVTKTIDGADISSPGGFDAEKEKLIEVENKDNRNHESHPSDPTNDGRVDSTSNPRMDEWERYGEFEVKGVPFIVPIEMDGKSTIILDPSTRPVEVLFFRYGLFFAIGCICFIVPLFFAFVYDFTLQPGYPQSNYKVFIIGMATAVHIIFTVFVGAASRSWLLTALSLAAGVSAIVSLTKVTGEGVARFSRKLLKTA